MTNDPPAQPESHLSDQQASDLTRHRDQPELAAFVAALEMRRPVSTDKAALLLEHIQKEQMTAHTQSIADQMRLDHWEEDLSDGESLILLAERAQAYLNSEQGIKLFNDFVKTFARTTGSML